LLPSFHVQMPHPHLRPANLSQPKHWTKSPLCLFAKAASVDLGLRQHHRSLGDFSCLCAALSFFYFSLLFFFFFLLDCIVLSNATAPLGSCTHRVNSDSFIPFLRPPSCFLFLLGRLRTLSKLALRQPLPFYLFLPSRSLSNIDHVLEPHLSPSSWIAVAQLASPSAASPWEMRLRE